MSRTSDLEARRRTLLTRCEEQRAELAYRLEQLRPSAQVADWGGARAEVCSESSTCVARGAGGNRDALQAEETAVVDDVCHGSDIDSVAGYDTVEVVCDLAVVAEGVSLSATLALPSRAPREPTLRSLPPRR